MKNVLLVVDTRNLNYCITKTFPGRDARLDYQKYVEKCVGPEDHLYRAFAFSVNPQPNNHEFVILLKKLGLEVHLNRAVPGDKIRFVNANVLIALTVMDLVNSGKIDRVILGSTDFGLYDLILAIKSKRLICDIHACSIPNLFKEVANNYTEITEDLFYKPNSIVAED